MSNLEPSEVENDEYISLKYPPAMQEDDPIVAAMDKPTELNMALAREAYALSSLGREISIAHDQAITIDILLTGLQLIIDRSNTGDPGTSKVGDMRKIAQSLLAQHGGA